MASATMWTLQHAKHGATRSRASRTRDTAPVSCVRNSHTGGSIPLNLFTSRTPHTHHEPLTPFHRWPAMSNRTPCHSPDQLTGINSFPTTCIGCKCAGCLACRSGLVLGDACAAGQRREECAPGVATCEPWCSYREHCAQCACAHCSLCAAALSAATPAGDFAMATNTLDLSPSKVLPPSPPPRWLVSQGLHTQTSQIPDGVRVHAKHELPPCSLNWGSIRNGRRVRSVGQTTLPACCELCRALPTCAAFNHNSRERLCFLLGEPGTMKLQSDPSLRVVSVSAIKAGADCSCEDF